MNTMHRTDRDPFLEPGEVVWANVNNPILNPGCRPKPRPVILLERQGGRWLVMGLTTLSTFADGTPREAVQNPAALGLSGRSYLWGRPTRVCPADIRDHAGWVDEPTATQLAAHPEVPCTVEVLLGEDEQSIDDAA